jgi:tape measure domain-containing protein
LATRTDELIVLLRADIKGLEASLQSANRQISSFRKNADSETMQLERSLQRVTARIITMAGAYAAFRVGKGIVDAAVQMQALESKMLAATGSAEIAAAAMQYVRDTAQRLGLDVRSTADGFASFSASALRAGLTFQETKDIFTGVSEAATAMRLSNERTQLVFMALGQMASKGTVSMEELRQQLGESLPGALQIFAKAMGKPNDEFIKMVENGQVTTRDLIKFGAALKTEFAGAASQAADSAQASFNRFGNAWLDLSNKMANNGFLDAVTDATKRLTDQLGDPATQEGLTAFAKLLGDIAQGAVTAASALGKLYGAGTRAIELIGDTAFSTLFGEEGVAALNRARMERRGFGNSAGDSAYTGNATLDAMLAQAEAGMKANASNATGDYTLNPDAKNGGETAAQKALRERLARQREQLRNRVDGIRRNNAGETDPGKQAALEYAAQQKELEKALKAKAISEQEYRDASLEAEIAYQSKLTDVRQKASDLEVDMRERTFNSIAGLMQVFAGKNKAIAIAMLAFDKARAISQAIMETHVAAAAALKYDPTGATSARVTTLGYMNVAAIAATGIAQLATMGGGGGGSSVSAGSYNSGSSDYDSQTSSSPSRSRTYFIDLGKKTIFSQNDIRNLLEQMQETIDDGTSFVVSR